MTPITQDAARRDVRRAAIVQRPMALRRHRQSAGTVCVRLQLTKPVGRGAPPRGLGAVAVIVVLVLLSAVAAAVVRFGMQGQTMVQQDVQALHAAAAARSGIDWGLFQALKGSWTTCNGASQTLDLSTDGGMRVTVSCSSTVYNEGKDSSGADQAVRMFTIDAVACNSATSCPDATAAVRSGYAEVRRQVQATN